MNRNFDTWLDGFRESIAGYDYYVDFEKVYSNVDGITIGLNILNSLIGSSCIEQDFRTLYTKYPEEIRPCIPILLAVRRDQILVLEDEDLRRFDFSTSTPSSLDECVHFMSASGLFNLIQKHLVSNLVDYATGVEVGLDSNGRKNRGGHLMEDLVEKYLIEADLSYRKEMYLDDVERTYGVDLSNMSNNGRTRKRFDFVVKGDEYVYLIETNFYGGHGGGSKLNETARSYKMLAEEARDIPGIKFVWFTDGTAWRSARGNLRETFEVLDTIYSICDLENGVAGEMHK